MSPEKIVPFLNPILMCLRLYMIELWSALWMADGLLFSQKIISGRVLELMQWFPWQNHACFLCWAPWGLEDHGHLLLDCFGGRGFLQILGLFSYYLLCMMKYSKSLKFYIEEHFSEIVPPFVNIVCFWDALFFFFFYTVMLRTCSKST